MLYIDQPNRVGFSYHVPTNVTVDLSQASMVESNIKIADFSDGVPEQNNTFFVGTKTSQNVSFTANSNAHAAVAIWHFAQTWFEGYVSNPSPRAMC